MDRKTLRLLVEALSSECETAATNDMADEDTPDADFLSGLVDQTSLQSFISQSAEVINAAPDDAQARDAEAQVQRAFTLSSVMSQSLEESIVNLPC